jgi:hypothetical protein
MVLCVLYNYITNMYIYTLDLIHVEMFHIHSIVNYIQKCILIQFLPLHYFIDWFVDFYCTLALFFMKAE